MSFDLGATNLSTLAVLGVQHDYDNGPDAGDSMHPAKPPPAKMDSYELRPIPAYFTTEISRRPSTLTRKDSDVTTSKDAVYLDTFAADDDNFPPDAGMSSDRSTKTLPSNASLTEASPTARLSKQQKRTSMIHFLALCLSVWLMGWNDGTLGPMLPRIQSQYRIGYTIVSMIFIGNCAGYVTGAALNIWFNERFGLGKTIVGGALCQIVGYLIMLAAPPFPLVICAYVTIGFGMSIQNAQANGFVGSLNQHMTLKLGLMHASYGLGAFISPFSSTYFSNLIGRRWAFHFIISACLSLLNILVLVYVFRFRRQEDLLVEAGQEPNTETSGQLDGSSYKQIFHLKAMPLLIAFALIYIGVEVTLGGWIVTFIIRERHGGPTAGYISSGFFGGLMTGRVCLMWLNQMVGEKRIIFIYSVIAIALELTIWFVPSIIGNAVAVSMIGVVMGPMFPLLVSHMTHILPRWLLTGCVGLVAGIGMAGSAALPFITGLLASKYGIGALQPLMVSMMVCMLVLWALVPSSTRRTD